MGSLFSTIFGGLPLSSLLPTHSKEETQWVPATVEEEEAKKKEEEEIKQQIALLMEEAQQKHHELTELMKEDILEEEPTLPLAYDFKLLCTNFRDLCSKGWRITGSREVLDTLFKSQTIEEESSNTSQKVVGLLGDFAVGKTWLLSLLICSLASSTPTQGFGIVSDQEGLTFLDTMGSGAHLGTFPSIY